MFGHFAFGTVPIGAGLDWPAIDTFRAPIATSTELTAIFRNDAKEMLRSTDEMVHTVILGTRVIATNEIIDLHLSDHEYISAGDDDPADQPFVDVLIQPLAFEASIINGDGFSGIADGRGSIVISNGDGAYDYLEDERSLFGQPVAVRIGRLADPLAKHVLLLTGNIVDYEVNEAEVRIEVRDNAYRLDVPLSPQVYEGTGVANNDAALNMAGQSKPFAVGSVLNVTPALIDAEKSIFQAYTEATISSMTAKVYANGVLVGSVNITNFNDYLTISDLAAAAPSEDLQVCMRQGAFRLPFELDDTLITCDVWMPPFVTGPPYVFDTVGVDTVLSSTGILLHLLMEIAGFSEEEIDQASFRALLHTTSTRPLSIIGGDVLVARQVGYFASHDDGKSVAEALSDLLGETDYLGFNRSGSCYAGQFGTPDASPLLRFDDVTIRDAPHRERVPDGLRPPPWRWRVGWSKNWTVMTDNVAGAVGTDRREFLASEFRFGVAEDEEIQADYPGSRERMSGGYRSGQNVNRDPELAVADAERLLALHGRPRSIYRFEVGREGYLARVGIDTVHLTYPRLGLQNGKYLRIVSKRIDAASGTTELAVWG